MLGEHIAGGQHAVGDAAFGDHTLALAEQAGKRAVETYPDLGIAISNHKVRTQPVDRHAACLDQSAEPDGAPSASPEFPKGVEENDILAQRAKDKSDCQRKQQCDRGDGRQSLLFW